MILFLRYHNTFPVCIGAQAMPRRNRSPDRSHQPDEAASPPRIIGGRLRGRRLPHLPGGPTRPMKDRVRATLFDLLGPLVKDAVAIDLFAGTGSLGFEALSRGCRRAVFAERHFPTAAALRRSAAELGIAEACEIRTGDVLAWSRRLPDLPADGRWIVFVSPPWAMLTEQPEAMANLVATLMAASPPGSVMAVESDEAFDPGLLPDPHNWEHRPLPPAVLHFHGRLVS
jgi:16S rRNA (guanine966-N2)-methyltransferase